MKTSSKFWIISLLPIHLCVMPSKYGPMSLDWYYYFTLQMSHSPVNEHSQLFDNELAWSEVCQDVCFFQQKNSDNCVIPVYVYVYVYVYH
jgi:hypothetical protein